MNSKKVFEYLLSVPKSIYVSFRLLPFRQAVRIPIFVRYNTKLLCLNGNICLQLGGGKTGSVRIGFGEVGIFDKIYERSILQLAGKLTFQGTAFFGSGSRIYVGHQGEVIFGDHFINTARMTICCENRMSFGHQVLVSWNTSIVDTDFHRTINPATGEIKDKYGVTIIGDHVWIGMGVTILKNSTIPNGCILGAGSLVNKRFITEHCLIAGNPAKVVKEGVTRAEE